MTVKREKGEEKSIVEEKMRFREERRNMRSRKFKDTAALEVTEEAGRKFRCWRVAYNTDGNIIVIRKGIL